MTMLAAIATAHRSAAQPFPAGKPDNGATQAKPFAALLEKGPDLGNAAPATLPGMQAPVPMMGAAAAAPALASPQRSAQEGLFSFSELGMFGRNGAQTGPAPEQIEAPGVACTAGMVERAISPAGQSPFMQQNAPQPSALRAGEQEAGPAQSMRATPVPLLARSGLLVEAVAATEPAVSAPRGNDVESFSLGGSGAVARPNLPAQLSRSANPVSVLVSGPGQALTIVARASGADPAQIRRLIEAAAAEFDVSVAEFHFNGSPTEPSFPSAIGGNHGNRSR